MSGKLKMLKICLGTNSKLFIDVKSGRKFTPISIPYNLSNYVVNKLIYILIHCYVPFNSKHKWSILQ